MCAGDKYVAAGDKRSKVGMGVAGDPNYGNDSPHNASQGLRPQIRTQFRPHPKKETVGGQVKSVIPASFTRLSRSANSHALEGVEDVE